MEYLSAFDGSEVQRERSIRWELLCSLVVIRLAPTKRPTN